MRLLHASAFLVGALAFQVVLAEKPCGEILRESPTSSAARICSSQGLEGEEKKLRQLEKQIDKALSGDTGLSLSKKSFRKAQRDWKAFRASNCWLEAFQVGEPTATQLACEVRMTACRTENLKVLLAAINGDGGYFSTAQACK